MNNFICKYSFFQSFGDEFPYLCVSLTDFVSRTGVYPLCKYSVYIYLLLIDALLFLFLLKKSTYMICNLIHVYLNKSCVEVQTNTVQKLSEVYNSWRTVQGRKKSGRTPPVSRIVAKRRGGKIVLLLKIFFTTVLSTHT